jgi:hypothetical protein
VIRRRLDATVLLVALSVGAALLLPVDLIIFKGQWMPEPPSVITLGVLLSACGLGWYVRRPVDKRPSNIVNRWVGLPVLLVGASFAVSFTVTAVFSGLLIPLGHGLIFGTSGPKVVEVRTNLFVPTTRRKLLCPHSLYLADEEASLWDHRICFFSAETKRVVMEQTPRGYLSLSGWGSDWAYLYWAVAPAAAPAANSEAP